MSAATAPITYAPPILWAAARALISTIFALFGEPSAIAAQHTHRKSERTLLLKWLRAGEALTQLGECCTLSFSRLGGRR